jgi:RimJ/RimL family protein N-acetyltransferase
MLNPYISGKSVYLRHPTEEDALGKWHEWFSDEETTKYIVDQYWPNSVEGQLAHYRTLAEETIRGDRRQLVLSVVTTKEDLHIGVVGLTRINWVHQYADLVIVIGDQKYRRIPYTIEAHELMHKVAFLRLNLLNVRSFYASNNKGAIAVQKLFKYTKVGVYENLYTIDGKRVDLVTGMLSKEAYLKKLHP